MPRFDHHLTTWANLEGVAHDDLARALDGVAPDVVLQARTTTDSHLPLDLRPVATPSPTASYRQLLGLDPLPA